MLILTLASAACAMAPGAGALIACRAMQGIGAACIMPLSLPLLTAAGSRALRAAIISAADDRPWSLPA